ncbi:unnamed protein product [Diabrotica balteata]|uniref:Uncharacterized protein n=1 Tax=Diabrotica balteata TaxID=107213 RepID=A0A9N9SZY4_DIABA|nr:unnamed protein product [Diabrotica balteata]
MKVSSVSSDQWKTMVPSKVSSLAKSLTLVVTSPTKATKLGLFRAAVPFGASTGIYEALEFRYNVKKEYHAKGLKTAIKTSIP